MSPSDARPGNPSHPRAKRSSRTDNGNSAAGTDDSAPATNTDQSQAESGDDLKIMPVREDATRTVVQRRLPIDLEDVQLHIMERPVTSVTIALGVGAVLGTLLARR
jgi:ElaB/YqjD/DUF883 family membrane-anchored ribosome-binding protein